MGNNRRKGHGFERIVRLKWREHGWEKAETSRYASREKDDQKVDLCYTDPYNVQCKSVQAINLHTVLSEMPDDDNMNIVFHKRNRKGVIVAMSEDTFWVLVRMHQLMQKTATLLLSKKDV